MLILAKPLFWRKELTLLGKMVFRMVYRPYINANSLYTYTYRAGRE